MLVEYDWETWGLETKSYGFIIIIIIIIGKTKTESNWLFVYHMYIREV